MNEKQQIQQPENSENSENPEKSKKKAVVEFVAYLFMIAIFCAVAFYICHAEITKSDLRGQINSDERQIADLEQRLSSIHVTQDNLGAVKNQELDTFGPMTLTWTDQDGQEFLYFCDGIEISYHSNLNDEIWWYASPDNRLVYPSYAETGPQTYYAMRPVGEFNDYPEIYVLELREIDGQVVEIERQYTAVSDHIYFNPEDKGEQQMYLASSASCSINFKQIPIGHIGSIDGDVHLTYKDVSLPEPEKCDRCACPDCCCKDCRCVAN